MVKQNKDFNLMEFRKKLIADQRVIKKYLEGRIAELNVVVDNYKKVIDDGYEEIVEDENSR